MKWSCCCQLNSFGGNWKQDTKMTNLSVKKMIHRKKISRFLSFQHSDLAKVNKWFMVSNKEIVLAYPEVIELYLKTSCEVNSRHKHLLWDPTPTEWCTIENTYCLVLAFCTTLTGNRAWQPSSPLLGALLCCILSGCFRIRFLCRNQKIVQGGTLKIRPAGQNASEKAIQKQYSDKKKY